MDPPLLKFNDQELPMVQRRFDSRIQGMKRARYKAMFRSVQKAIILELSQPWASNACFQVEENWDRLVIGVATRVAGSQAEEDLENPETRQDFECLLSIAARDLVARELLRM
jgi:hypothetical protein